MAHSFEYLWIAIGLVWLAELPFAKSIRRAESPFRRLLHLLIILSGFALVFSTHAAIGPLGLRLYPDSQLAAWAGLAIAVAGALLTVWARLILGGNWSAVVAIKNDHALVRRGPYALVRHPIYSGLLLLLLGSVIANGELRAFLGFAIVGVGLWYKSRQEERYLAQQFGADYTLYRTRVRALIPYLL